MSQHHRSDYINALAAVTASIGTAGHSNWLTLIETKIAQLTEKMINAEPGGPRDAIAEQIKGLRNLRDEASKRPKPRKDSKYESE